MDGSYMGIAKALLPRTPLILKTALLHSLWLSQTSTKWDLRTEITVKVLRSFMDGPPTLPISKIQRFTLKDPGVKGPMWVSRVTLPAPAEDDVRQALFAAIEGLNEGGETYTVPELRPVGAEWTGYRAGVDGSAPELEISEEEKYTNMVKETKSDVTILYFHGAALLDALLAYLMLLYPPPSSLHASVSPAHIILSGDSAGGGLSLSLLQLLLELRRQNTSLTFHGQKIDNIPLPAGVAANSGWFDLTRCLPSINTNAHFDYLPPIPPPTAPPITFPDDPTGIWPASPPRSDLYTDASALCHPLVSPLAAKSWQGAPPLYLVYGEEMLLDEGRVLAARAVAQGVRVTWDCFEAMPHTFAMVLEGSPVGKRCFEAWAAFCKQAVDESGGKVQTRGTWVQAKTLEESPVDVATLADDLAFDEVGRRMHEVRERKSKGEEGEGKALPKL
ncbi:MAG: hypothetical protein M1827_002754 [Pycnora praestabilis]|nr:MAG: hypothetical protein M1827_002754 [Pycnora praestabilis]